MTHSVAGAQDISIYLGNVCNFDCSYCDRAYIKDTSGGQRLKTGDLDDIIKFLESLITHEGILPVNMISFHGGEPFVYAPIMDAILTRIEQLLPNNELVYFIQSNGSLILSSEWFIKKWGNRLTVSISYDFLFQPINRTDYDIQQTVALLKQHSVMNVQYQTVLPIQDPTVFSMDMIKNIVSTCNSTGVTHINLIPLRHIRGRDKFKVILDDLDINAFFMAFVKFVEILYVMGVHVVVDGHSADIDKRYFSNHKQLILSPDGLIYPEYDFLEYKMTNAAIGKWRTTPTNVITIHRADTLQESTLISDGCNVCEMKEYCGLKFLYHEFDKEPGGACREFYKRLNVIIQHVHKLQQHPTLLHSIGI